ncbi:MAG: type III PLP-dependent enzyme [Gammaproteobacteria bacterium]|nr:type III PLP-dependent enzyme [Gammaproteobacteria bacterium]
METAYESVASLLRARQPGKPVYCIYPHIYRDAAEHFLANFPGRVLYAVKANNHRLVVQALGDAGIEHFDCASLQEIELVKSLFPDATCYLMNPVRLEDAARRAQDEFGTRHFMVDHRSGVAPLLAEIDAGRSVVFARMAVSHHSAMADLSSKFGALPDEIPAVLQDIRDAGAEAALAFNVGTGVTEPGAYTYAMGLAREVLENTPFPVRLLDIGGGFPRPYPGFIVPPLDEFFAAIKGIRHELPLGENSEIMAEPGRGLSAPGMSTIARVLLRKEDRLYLNDGMYGAFWELRFKGHVRYPACAWRGHEPFTGNLHSFRLFGPTCDSSDEMPGSVELPADVNVGDYIEFGSMGAYSLSGRTTFNGFYSDDVVTIDSESCSPPV